LIQGRIAKCYTFKDGRGAYWFEKDDSGKYKSR